MPVRALIVDDNQAFLAAARTILDGPEVGVVGVAANGADALRSVHELKPDLVLLDIDLGAESGFALAREIAQQLDGASPKMILISAHPEDEFAELIAESPALGFLTKSDLCPATVAGLLRGG